MGLPTRVYRKRKHDFDDRSIFMTAGLWNLGVAESKYERLAEIPECSFKISQNHTAIRQRRNFYLMAA